MSYVEDIEKINKLAKELLKHGMATSLVDAISKAQATLKDSGTINLDISDAKQKLTEHEVGRNDVPEVKIQAETLPEPHIFPRQEIGWQEAMSKNSKYVAEQLGSMQNALSKLNAEVDDLRKMIDTLKNIQSKFNMSGLKDQININIDEPMERQQPVEQKHEPHPRQGNYKPEDVSIEKMFYYGNK
jgi:hypothetical protein